MTEPTGQLCRRGPSQHADKPRFRSPPVAGQAIANADPGRVSAISALQRTHQFGPDGWKLMHMLVPIDEIGRAAQRAFKEVELRLDCIPDRAGLQPARIGSRDKTG